MVDVSIVGGGPAGAAAAIALATWGHDVAVFARASSHPSLAESLPPSSAKILEKLGVRGAVDAAGFVRATGNTVHWGSAQARIERFGGGALGYQVPRNDFDDLLLGEAERAGALVYRAASGRGAERDESRATSQVVWEKDGARHETNARWVFDCSGRAGLIARKDWRRPESRARTMALVGAWRRGDRWPTDDETHTIVESYDGGWAWSVPASRDVHFVTVMVDPAVTDVHGGTALATDYHRELARAPALQALVAGASLVSAPWARDASSYSAARFAEPGVLLVGDAASFIDPLSSYGVKKALVSGWLAAVVAHTALTNSEMMVPALDLYEARERAMHDHLRARSAALARETVATYSSEFWRGRAEGDEPAESGEPDVDALRTDPALLAALDELKRRPRMALRPSDTVRIEQRPTIRGIVVALADHLAAPGAAERFRYVRNVDLVLLFRLAPQFDEVPAVFEAYNRAAPPVPLPDFLGALSLLMAKGFLRLQ